MKGPTGQKRPRDTNAAAVMVGRIATGEIKEKPNRRANSGKARAEALTSERRKEISQKALKAKKKPK